jgi:hypothetical protein
MRKKLNQKTAAHKPRKSVSSTNADEIRLYEQLKKANVKFKARKNNPKAKESFLKLLKLIIEKISNHEYVKMILDLFS